MKQTIDVYGFRRAFERADRKDQFSNKGLHALFDWFEEYEDECGEEIELDVIAICCDFQEFDNLEDFQKQYSYDYDDMESIEQETIVIYLGDEVDSHDPDGSSGFIIQQF